jgi:hypothetical protein
MKINARGHQERAGVILVQRLSKVIPKDKGFGGRAAMRSMQGGCMFITSSR